MKLVLQPILENAIYHGIKEAEQDGRIAFMAGGEQDDIYLEVSDNGYGMSRKK